MTWETENFRRSRWLWRSGVAGWNGVEQPFLVWKDHKNLEYLRSAKRLNSRQARWALFFNRFNFNLSYLAPKMSSTMLCPDPDPSTRVPTNILPESCVVGAVTLEVEERVKQVQVALTVLVGCPICYL